MAPTPTGISGTVTLVWVPGALRQCRNSGASMKLVQQLGSRYLFKANSTLTSGKAGGSAGYLLGLHMVAGTKYIANVYTATGKAMHSNAVNQTLAKLLP
jgi:hypothetical protein